MFLLIQVEPADLTFRTPGLGSQGLFTAIIVALVVVRVQKLFTDRGIVITMPETVPSVVYQSFLSLVPLLFLVVTFWLIRFVAGVDINHVVQAAFGPLVFALNTLPGILVYAFLVSLLWSVGIHGDNALDAIVAPIFLQYLAENVAAMTSGSAAAVRHRQRLLHDVRQRRRHRRDARARARSSSAQGRRRSGRSGALSLPTQVFQINEPIFFGLPIVLNPVFMVPYVLNALILTTGSYLLMSWGLIQRPFINVPWTTPPIIGHYLVTGGDWRAAAWGVVSLVDCVVVYYPFARAAERARAQHGVV